MAIAKALPHCKLEWLELGYNDLGSEGVAALVEALPRSKLRVLSLDGVAIDDEGMVALANMLPRCGLEELDLGCIRLWDEGFAAFARAIKSVDCSIVKCLMVHEANVEELVATRTNRQRALVLARTKLRIPKELIRLIAQLL